MTAAVRFRFIRNRLRIWHNLGRFAPFCWDCRWLRAAQREGEFYAHDDPRWYIREILAGPRDFVTAPPVSQNRSVGTGQTWVWDVEHGPRRVS